MSTATLALPRPRRLRVFEFLANVIAGMQDGLRISRRYHELAAMTDAELAGLGLTRQDIARVAIQSAD
ncbi:DUF1127 domain-containing protein [Xanthobacteraceae bacterium Astr-EGSB]|uniref:DUF1127 domain-containing protein n=1 Tax=Astrobacterium formosum TaxID=3069710 RepID=UPI0027AF51FF|nr:DUF1127 domain-containing protein [Xanthobacteraceae bacterium Astr-EGSB]